MKFFKVVGIFLALVLTLGVIGVALYFTVPKVKDWTDTHILKQEQTTSKEDTEKDEQIATLTAQLQEKEQTITSITASLNEQKALVSSLQASAEADAETIASLQESISAKETELETLEADKVTLQGQISELESDVEENQNQITALQNENAEMSAEIEELETDLLANSTTISELNAQIEANNTTISELQSMNNSLNVSRDILYAQIEEKEEQISELQNQVATLTTDRDKALTSLAETQAELETAQAEVSSLESDLALKEVEIASLNEQIESYQNALNRDENLVYIEEIIESGNFNAIRVDNNFLISSASEGLSGLFLFNTIDYSCTKVDGSSSYGFSYVNTLQNGDLFIQGAYDLFLYNKTNNSVESIIRFPGTVGSHVLKNGNVLFTFKGNNKGVYLYDLTTASMTCIFEDSKDNYLIYAELNSGSVIISSTSNNGVYYYDINSNSVSYFDSSNYKYQSAHQVKDKEILIFGYSKIELIDLEGQNITTLYTGTYYNYYYVCTLENGNVLMTSNGLDTGLLLYNVELKEIKPITTTGYGYTTYLVCEDFTLISGSSTYYINNLDNSSERVYQKNFGCFFKLKDGSIFASSIETGMYLFDTNEKTFANMYSSDKVGYWRSVEEYDTYAKFYSKSTLNGGGNVCYYIYETGEFTTTIE